MSEPSKSETATREEPAIATCRALLQPITDELDLEIFELARQGARLRIVVDRRSYQGPGTGVTIEELTRVTRELNASIELEGGLGFSHELEVSSPGVERDLRNAADWRRHRGELVRAVIRDPERTPEGGGRVVEGRIEGLEGDDRVVIVVGDENESFLLADVQRARTRFEMPGQKREKSGAGKSKRAARSKE